MDTGLVTSEIGEPLEVGDDALPVYGRHVLKPRAAAANWRVLRRRHIRCLNLSDLEKKAARAATMGAKLA
jgi:hypothetical protein